MKCARGPERRLRAEDGFLGLARKLAGNSGPGFPPPDPLDGYSPFPPGILGLTGTAFKGCFGVSK